MSNFSLGGIMVPFVASQDFSQTFEDIDGKHRRRKMDGTLFTQDQWTKLRTRLTGNGWLPYGLSGLDYATNMVLMCAAPRSITGTGGTPHVIDIPAARRSDSGYVAYGVAVVDNVWQKPGDNIVTNTMTISTVSGADYYMAIYYPQITVQADYQEMFDQSSGVWRWSLNCEET